MLPKPVISAEVRSGYERQGAWRAGRTFLDDFLDRTADRPDRPAIVTVGRDAASRVSLSFAEVGELVDRCALSLIDLGVETGEVVSFQLPNRWEFTVLSLACARIGAVPNAIAPILRSREVRYMLQTVQARVFVFPPTFRGFDHAAMVSEIATDLPMLKHKIVVGEPTGAGLSFGTDLVQRGPVSETERRELGLRRPAPNDVAEVQFTSGTTSRPKGVVHTYNSLYASYRGIVEELTLSGDDVVLVLSTMAHQTGFLNGCVMPMAEGMTAVYQEQWDAAQMLDLVVSEGVTYTSGATPYMVDACAIAEHRSGPVAPKLRYFRSGGSAVPQAVVRRVRAALGTQIVVAWGMTENGVCTISRKDATADEIAASDGYPLRWVRLKITDLDGTTESPPGEDGLLWVKTASQCADYLGNHDVFVASFDADGWFNTGDIAHLTPDGAMRMTGRHKDMVIRGGENVPVVEVEDALSSHPAIADVAVVGVPDQRLGERACAVVVPAAGREIDLDLIKDHLAELGMAKQFWPELVMTIDVLPRTVSGKVSKATLREHALLQFGAGRVS